MATRLLFLLFLIYCCAPAAGKRKNSLLTVPFPAPRSPANDTMSNDSNTYLYDLMVDLITINGEKLRPSSKSSKLPSRSPVIVQTRIPSSALADDDDNWMDDNSVWSSYAPTWLGSTHEATPVPTAVATTSDHPPSNPTIVTSSNAPSPIISDENVSTPNSSPPSMIETSIPTLNTGESSSTHIPTQTFEDTQTPTSNVTATSNSNSNVESCPKPFNSSTEYHEFDVVSMRSTIYKCKAWPKDTYCNSFEPGSKYSDHGWTVEGPCVINSPTHYPTGTYDEMSPTPTIPITTEPPTAEENLTSSPIKPVVESVTIVPTSTPTFNSTGEGTSAVSDDTLSVSLPRIICDISLSPNLTQKFQDKHILLVAMTNTLFILLSTHLMNEVAGISLSVQVTINSNGNETTASMARLKADFTGSVSFSIDDSSPTESDLVDVLLSHFSIDEFTKRLTSPLKKTRSASSDKDSTVKVNSVFFFDDGMLHPAGMASHRGYSTSEDEETTLELANLPLAVGVFVLTAVGFTLAMVIFVVHSKRVNHDEDETVLPQPVASSTQAIPPTTPKVESTDPEVEINRRKRNPFFGGIDSLSDLSSLSESPYTDRSIQDIAPTTPSLGIAAPNYRYIFGARTPYTDDASVDDEKEWRMRTCMLETP